MDKLTKRKPISNAEHKQRVDDFIKRQMDMFLEIIKKNQTSKWEKPWKDMFGGLGSLPHNPVTKHLYQGGNILFLMFDMALKKTSDPRYLTLPQAKRYADEFDMDPCKVRIKKGEKAAYILQPIIIGGKKKDDFPNDKKSEQSNENHKPDKNLILDELIDDLKSNTKTEDRDKQNEEEPVLIRFKVVPRFNGSQFTGIPSLDDLKNTMLTGGAKVKPHSLVSHFVASSQVEVQEGPSAAYKFKRDNPSADYIQMPPIEAFDEPDQWASTLLHEMFHASGGYTREKRLVFDRRETIEEYAREEIRAQMFMILASAALDLPVKLDQEADYVKGFSQVSNLDYKELYKEFKASNKIFTEVLLPFLANEQPKVDWFPDKSIWPEWSEDAQLEAVKATARVLSPIEPTPQSVKQQNDNIKSETTTPVESTDFSQNTNGLDIGVFDLVTDEKPQPPQTNLFAFLDEKSNEGDQEDGCGIRMR